MSDGESNPDFTSMFTVPGWTMAETMTELTRAWTSASEQVLQNITAMNEAAFAAFERETSDERPLASPDPTLAYTHSGWSFERDVECVGQISVGDIFRFSKEFTDADVEAFAEATGDTNRLHLDESFAEETRFGKPIVHGVLVLGLVSAALARLPGLSIYLSQDVNFLRAVTVGRRYTAVVEVVEKLSDDRFRLSTTVIDEDEEPVVEGESVVLIDDVTT